MSIKIVLFDDTKEYGDKLRDALQAQLREKGQAVWFSTPKEMLAKGVYEERLAPILKTSPFDGANLIVADRDLSKTEDLEGLSESTVKRVADKLAIPECAYARDAASEKELLQNAEMREARIVISLQAGDARFAEQAVSVAEGFIAISKQLPAVRKAGGKKSPGRLLANILGKPEYADKISLYASGDQNRLAGVLKGSSNDEEENKRLTCLFGYWLWDSVLRYPGVVVNQIAASSYLNICESDFGKTDVQSLFDNAIYAGPFAAAKGRLWWRGMLDDLVAASGVPDGREFAAQKLKRPIAPSQCCEDKTKTAGYYCMLSHKPVSLENSEAGLSWFPRGRIWLASVALSSKKKFLG